MCMLSNKNSLGQEIGTPLPHWQPCSLPAKQIIEGTYCRLEPLNPERHGAQLWQAFNADTEDRIWTYLPYGPFNNLAELHQWLSSVSVNEDPLFFAIIDTLSDKALGIASYLRMQPAAGVIEVGHINFSPALQKTTAATEAMYLMMQQVFALGYRRYEWKCDDLNLGSKQAAQRLGFNFDGLFKQATVYKERNRDTAWFSLLDADWPAMDLAYQRWLSPDNFTPDGSQLRALNT